MAAPCRAALAVLLLVVQLARAPGALGEQSKKDAALKCLREGGLPYDCMADKASLTKKQAAALSKAAAAAMPGRPAADRGTYVDFLVFVDDADNLPVGFKDDHFNPVVVVPSAEVVGDLNLELGRHRAQFIVSIGADDGRFWFLETLPAQARYTWFHLERPEMLTKAAVEAFFWKAIRFANEGGTPTEPLMSIFTPAYKSKSMIYLPYHSLRRQSYQNWEWIIYDDSPADHNETWPVLQELAAKDYRIRIFKSDRNDGYIGSVKRKACLEGTGKLLVELDHDDVLEPDCLQLLLEAYLKYPGAGYFYTQAIEQFENTNKSVGYSQWWSFGHGAHFKRLVNGSWFSEGTTVPWNEQTLRHIVGVPNHVRVWSREAYLAIGGHTKGLPVADDYDLTLRAIFKYPAVYIRHMAYLQYRREDGGTFTFKRNALIQRMVHVVGHGLDTDIHDLLVSHGYNDTGFESWQNQRHFYLQWEPLPPHIFHEYHRPTVLSPPDRPRITVALSAGYNRSEAELDRALRSLEAQDYDNWELTIVGEGCPVLNDFMMNRKEFFGRLNAAGHEVRWHNIYAHFAGGSFATHNFAARGIVQTDWIVHMTPSVEFRRDHLSSLARMVAEDPRISYAISSMQIGKETILAPEPRLYRVTTGSFMYRRTLARKYGGWRSQQDVGAANDWEFVSRWKSEPWAATLQPTVILHDVSDADASFLAQVYR